MSIWAALGFMLLGGIIVELAEIKAWQRYKIGKTEGRNQQSLANLSKYSKRGGE
jgi:hypothetical protein